MTLLILLISLLFDGNGVIGGHGDQVALVTVILQVSCLNRPTLMKMRWLDFSGNGLEHAHVLSSNVNLVDMKQ